MDVAAKLGGAMDQLNLTKNELNNVKTLGVWFKRLSSHAQIILTPESHKKHSEIFHSSASHLHFETGSGMKYINIAMVTASRLDKIMGHLDLMTDEREQLKMLGERFKKLELRARVILLLGHEKNAGK